MAQSWAELPLDRVVYLAEVSATAVELSLELPPDDAPAIIRYRPAAVTSSTLMISQLLGELDTVATGLFPAWLPGADMLDGPGGNGTAAVRALAARAAATTPDFGPFLADLAERSFGARRRPGGRTFGDEVRAVGLARVIAASFRRPRAALLIHVPDGLTPAAERSMVAACEWFVYHGRAGVWLTGPALRDPDLLDRMPMVVPRLTGPVARLAGHPPPIDPLPADLPTISYPALAGRPHPASDVEKALEKALAARPWAAGRSWNQTYRFGPLSNPVKPDLLWPAERCVVELDGPEHRVPAKYELDRSRDVELQLHGFAVLRFTNEQVIGDLDAVLRQIERFIDTRRQQQREGRTGWLARR